MSMNKSTARAPVAQLVRASDQNSEHPGSNPGWISTPFFHQAINVQCNTVFFSQGMVWCPKLFMWSRRGGGGGEVGGRWGGVKVGEPLQIMTVPVYLAVIQTESSHKAVSLCRT